LLLVSAAFFIGLVYIFAEGEPPLAIALAAESPLRGILAFLALGSVFSVATSLLLFSSWPLTRKWRLALLVAAAVQAVVGMVVASVSIGGTLAPLWFLFRFYRGDRA
jgi:hypothetical protein